LEITLDDFAVNPYLSIDRHERVCYGERWVTAALASQAIMITFAQTHLGRRMNDISDGIDLDAVPSGTGCVECLATGGWWFHLRRCAKCGHIGCCDSSPNQHATAHFRETGHFIMTSFEPGEDWFWNYRKGEEFDGPKLAPPQSRPPEQPSPGPAGRVPADWEDHLN
jgi:hypothetical protein